MAAHKRDCDPKQLFQKTIFFSLLFTVLNYREHFFQGTVFLYFSKLFAAIHSSMDTELF